MQILNYKLDAYVPFENESIESFLVLCENAINKMISDEHTIFKLKSAIHELLINSLEHGYKREGGKIHFYVEKNDKNITLEIADEGSGFDPQMIDLENTGTDLNSINRRGWGLLIIKKLSDSMEITPNTPKGTKINVVISLSDM
ncbi:ATP-binding protein [Acetivibrio clariflavus]|uniref:Anti-sigma regulatory factor (Ser/Thr protein kinase) n=1 Tax=Acetivibrio clariflavus (strain DSM 19732 / NBRC 101661 / EBR45) TaxID=720554 RepID=G8LSQ3_ACECE|nr:ATP-binding protein [Acetivibrio clariflavus]AEV69405.1 anti-sigma regulatory factor (Ser/Thr protein kinase) [Acetivibrio clariflavus DSM 19732]